MELTSYLNKELAPSTAKRYQREITLFIQTLESKGQNAQSATYAQILHYLGELRAKNKHVSVTLHALQQYYSYLNHKEIRKDHPAKSIRLKDSKSRSIQVQDLFTKEELESLLNRVERYKELQLRNQILIGLLIYQGLTSEELLQLETADIDLEKATVFSKGTRRTNSRILPLNPKQIYPMMQYIHKERATLLKEETNQLFIGKNGKALKIDSIQNLFAQEKKNYPHRKLNARTIRQSVIANLFKKGNNLRKIQVFAGHKYPSTTELYQQTKVEQLKAEILKYHPLAPS